MCAISINIAPKGRQILHGYGRGCDYNSNGACVGPIQICPYMVMSTSVALRVRAP